MSQENLERCIFRYKTIYSITALILGMIAVISGYWLISLKYQYEVTGWMLNVFGCTILQNDNNLAPGFSLVLAGLVLVIITQYRIRLNRKSEGHSHLDSQALLPKFSKAMMGLIMGFLSMAFGIVLAENGGNLCPTDWATKLTSYENLYYLGILFYLVGIIILVATRYRIRINESLDEGSV